MPATTQYGIDVEVALGIGRQAQRGVWDDGTWDRNVWGQSDTDLGDWVDVTCSVLDGVELKAGTDDNDGLTIRWEAASCALTLLGDTFDPWAGPYAGLLGERTPVRVRWRPSIVAGAAHAHDLIPRAAEDDGWAHAFIGTIEAAGYQWTPAAPGGLPRAEVVATDDTSDLTAWDGIEQPWVGSGETASERVDRILSMVRWDPERRDVTPGGVTLLPTDLGDEAWSMLLDVADADLALMWIRRDGRFAYRPQGRVGEGVELQGRLVACPVDEDDVQVVTLGLAQPTVIRNWVSIAREKDPSIPEDEQPTPPVVTLIDDASVERFRAHRFSRTDLTYDDDEWSTTLAQALLASAAWPSPAPRRVVLSSLLKDPRVPALLLSIEPDAVFDVVDNTGTQWRMGAVGWEVEVRFASIGGSLFVDDLSRYLAAKWDDNLGFDRDRWGIGRA